MEETQVILVDINDEVLGLMEKIEAHKKALLHRAISVFICNSEQEWLLQRRALNKYHSGGLWTNTCCSHPFPGESIKEAAYRRLMEEMGIDCKLNELFSFIYMENLDNGLTEHELDHVFWGISDNSPNIDNDEVMDWKFIKFSDLQRDIELNPANYTVWFKKIFQRVKQQISLLKT
jgi:isopentenyl-diphosphate Delta-isomerase